MVLAAIEVIASNTIRLVVVFFFGQFRGQGAMKVRYFARLVVPILIGVGGYASRMSDWGHWIWRPSTPVMECPQLLELGERELGEVALSRFTIANIGGGDLIIDQVQTNCSCTGLEREVDGKLERVESLHLRRGERADLDIRVSVQGYPGKPSQNVVRFRCNDPERPISEIKVLVSRVNAAVTTVPTSVVFGNQPLGRESIQQLDVFDCTTES